jgi:hypothetical protein
MSFLLISLKILLCFHINLLAVICLISRGFDSDEVIQFFSIYLILLAAIWPWCRLGLYQKGIQGRFLGGEERPAHKGDNFTAIHEPIVQKTWQPRPLTVMSLHGLLQGVRCLLTLQPVIM